MLDDCSTKLLQCSEVCMYSYSTFFANSRTQTFFPYYVMVMKIVCAGEQCRRCSGLPRYGWLENSGDHSQVSAGHGARLWHQFSPTRQCGTALLALPHTSQQKPICARNWFLRLRRPHKMWKHGERQLVHIVLCLILNLCFFFQVFFYV